MALEEKRPSSQRYGPQFRHLHRNSHWSCPPFVAEDAPLEEQVPWLRERLEVLKGEVGELTEVLAQTQGNLSRQIMNVPAEAQEADTSLRAKLTEVATGRVRQEMAGLGLVVVGTFISAWG